MVVLGVHDGTHDAGAALVVDGVVVRAAGEERFTRKKGQGGWPAQALAECLAGGVEPDVVAFPGVFNPNPGLRVLRPVQARFELDGGAFYAEQPGLSQWLQFDSPFPRLRATPRRARALAALLGADCRRRGLPGRVVVYDHHLCHAASVWWASSGEPALVVVVDGVGDGLASSVWRGVDLLDVRPYPHSYGFLYASVTGLLGFRPFRHEGKLVGLAAVGDADAVRVPWPFEGPPHARTYTGGWGVGFGPLAAALRGHRREDVAAWLQRGVEADLRRWVRHWLDHTGLRRLLLAGGVFANVRLNQRLAELGVDALGVHPHMGDGGLAVGAALQAWAETTPGARPTPLAHVFLGSRFDDDALRAALDRAGLPARREPDLAEAVAARLADGRIVARFDGAMEYGPRALGNRSILASAAERGMHDRLNVALDRSDFMPFAPAVLAEGADAWIDGLAPIVDAARFMTVTAQARPAFAERAPAVVHADGSLRPQLVDGGGLGAILRAHGRRTGVPAVINTSFNLHEEPIVRTPAEAIATFRAGRLDTLVLGPWLVDAAP